MPTVTDRTGTRYRLGLRVHYFREVPGETPILFEATVLHRDEHLVIADKPHFLPVMPAGVHVRETLLTGSSNASTIRTSFRCTASTAAPPGW